MEKLKLKIEEELQGLHGRIGIVIEIDREGFYFNSKEVFQAASVIKVPILIEGLRQSEMGIINLNHSLTITSKAGGSGVLQALSDDVVLTINDLLTLMITVSDNTAANMLIDLLGIEAINASIGKMGLLKTVLNRKMMDFEAISQGRDNYTTPLDMIKCLKIINEESFLSEESREAALKMMNYQQFQDKLPAMMDLDRVVVGNKTGGLPQVEHDCAVIKYNGKTAYAVILMEQLDDLIAGKQIISRIGKHIYDYLMDESEN